MDVIQSKYFQSLPSTQRPRGVVAGLVNGKEPTTNDDDEKRDERKRILEEVRQRVGEASAAHSMSDDESEMAMLAMQLDAEQQRLKQLEHDDTVGFIWFGDNDDWIDKRLA